MSLLFESDYEVLKEWNLPYEEGETERFFIFSDCSLPAGLYDVAKCDVLVVIPPNYNQAGNDMFWTYPRLRRKNGIPIPATLDSGGGDNRVWNGKEFCRWSRHWRPRSNGSWRPGVDDIASIYRRIEWALSHPDGK